MEGEGGTLESLGKTGEEIHASETYFLLWVCRAMKGKGTVRRVSRVGRAAYWAAADDDDECSGAAGVVAAGRGRPSSSCSSCGIACACLSSGV